MLHVDGTGRHFTQRGVKEACDYCKLVSVQQRASRQFHMPSGGHPAAAKASGSGSRGLRGGRRQHPGHDVRHYGGCFLKTPQAQLAMLPAVQMMPGSP